MKHKAFGGLTKTVCERLHAKKRFLERYAIDYTKAVRVSLVNKIKKQKILASFGQSTRMSLHLVYFDGRYLPLAYDKLRGEITTVLPPEAIYTTEWSFHGMSHKGNRI